MRSIPVPAVLILGALQVGCGSSATTPVQGVGTPSDSGPSTTGPTGDDASGSAPDATRSGTQADASSPPGVASSDAASPGHDAGVVDASAPGHDAQVADAGASQPDAQGPTTGAGGDAASGCGGVVLGQGPLTTTATHLDIDVHDPSMIWDGSKYYLFATGGSLNVRSSPDILTYSNAGNIFPAVPAWVTAALGANPGSLWAPDISYFNGQFHVYYAGSTFGSNLSVIGLATTASLGTPQWVDQQMIIGSVTTDNFNAIDPNLSFDQNCTPWLAFGSFWDGIKMRQVDPTTGKLSTTNTTMYSLASRGGGAIEAASIISHNGFYYLFVSFDLCCQGVNSTYRTMVGRATSITGPYTDKAGASMLTGAAEQLLVTSGRYIGPGGGTAWRDGDAYLYAYHYYDGDDNGVSKLQIQPITFDSTDWIVLGDSLFP